MQRLRRFGDKGFDRRITLRHPRARVEQARRGKKRRKINVDNFSAPRPQLFEQLSKQAFGVGVATKFELTRYADPILLVYRSR